MYLFLIEIFHFMWGDDFIIIEVYHGEPILQTSWSSLVLFGEHEPDKVFVPHLVFGA